MLDADLPEPLLTAWTTDAGATEVARLALDGLLELSVTAPDRVRPVAEQLRAHHAGLAPLWHIVQATRTPDPVAALTRWSTELDAAAARAVETAIAWLDERRALIHSAPGSGLVEQIMLRRSGTPRTDATPIGVCGADAVGPTAILNIIGTGQLTPQMPTLIVTTSMKLVPEPVFGTLGSAIFETVPLSQFAAVVLDGEVMTPDEAGRRAAATIESP